MSKLDTSAELIKLSTLMKVEVVDIQFLETLPLPALIKLREQTADLLFNDGRKLFQNLAAASKLMPTGLTAMIAEKTFGPMLCARVAGEMPYQRAIDLAQKMSLPFLAEVCRELDPRRVRDIISNMPISLSRGVALELIKRKEFLVMGSFVGMMPMSHMAVIIKDIPEEALLHTGFFIEGKHQLSEIMRMLPDARLAKLVEIMQVNEDLWPEALAMMVHLEDELKRKMGDIAAAQDEAMLDVLTQAVYRLDLWKDALPLFASMSPGVQYILINMPSLQDRTILTAALENADRYALWGSLLPLVEFMSTDQRQLLADVVGTEGQAFQERIIDAAYKGHFWQPLFDVVKLMSPATREVGIGHFRMLSQRDPQLVARWEPLARERGLEDLIAEL